MKLRRLTTLLLLGWMALVVFAGWPPQVRPDLLQGVHDLSVHTIRLLGISAGQPLFHTQVNPWKQYAFCLEVRTDAGEVLFPPGGECDVDGFHWRLPPVNRATHRMLSAAHRIRGEGGRQAESDAYPSAVGRAYCLQPEERPAGIQAVWTWYFRHYDDGSVLRRNGVLFAYSCDEARLTTLAWEPDDEAVLAFWGDSPWR